jgi:hypothetical protein
MGQKYAAYSSTGAIAAFYDSVDSPVPASVTSALAITDGQWETCISTPGYTVVNGALVAPAPPTTAQELASAQSSQIAVLYAACSSAITASFTSNALDITHTYPSTLMDQSNQVTVANNAVGGLLWCETDATWSFVAHTQVQAQQVVADFTQSLNRCQSRLLALTKVVNAATTMVDVQSIVWHEADASG